MTNPLDEKYGPRPGRPTHEDFVRLVGIINEMDNTPMIGADAYQLYLASFADPESLTYMAMQRALRMVTRLGANDQLQPAMASLFLDGFMAGYLYREGKETEETTED